MTTPSFVTFTALDGTSVRVNSQDNIVALTPIPAIQLPAGVTDGTTIEFDDRTLQVRGTVAATAAVITTPTTNGLGPIVLANIPLGAVAYGSLGTDSFGSATGILQFSSEGYNPQPRVVNSIAVLNGTVAGTDNVTYIISDANGVVLGTTASTLHAGTDAFQTIALVTPFTLPAGRFFVTVKISGNTAKLRFMAANTYPNATKSEACVYAVAPTTITAPTSFQATVGPFFKLA